MEDEGGSLPRFELQDFTDDDLVVATGMNGVGRTGEMRQGIDQLRLTLRPSCEVLGLRAVTTALGVLTGERALL